MDARALFGTDAAPAPARRLGAGRASVTLEDGGLRHLRAGGVELIRAVAFIVRDRDWGTLTPEIRDLSVTEGAQTRVTYAARYAGRGATLDVAVSITLRDGACDFVAEARAEGAFETNRTGFNVLHPITGLAGEWVRVGHSAGPAEETRFPALIEPWQPFMDITALTHRAGGLEVECRFEGDTFEMEDQRQWGDASFKTYVRPLALPWPYVIEDGTVLRQAVRLRWHPAPAAAQAAAPAPSSVAGPQPARFPQTALVLTGDDAARAARAPTLLAGTGAQRVLCHLDATAGGGTAARGAADLAAFAALQAALPALAFDLELIAACPPGGDLGAEFAAHAAAVAASGLRVDSVMVCPAVDRQSTPPGSDWPPCPPLDSIHRAARAAFAAHGMGRHMGGGMASFFPELNRKRPPVDLLDFVTHGLCPIVHAADDLSVMETLEAVPHILASARAIIGAGEYRLGPSTIAMRQNPYGSRTIPNPGRGRVCMADDDPRQDGAFAAAWAIGLAACIAPAGLSVWTPAALFGPRGLYDDAGAARPVAAAVTALAALAGQRVTDAGIATATATGPGAEPGVEPGAESGAGHRLARIVTADAALFANLTPRPLPLGRLGDLPPFGWRSVATQDLQALPQGLMP